MRYGHIAAYIVPGAQREVLVEFKGRCHLGSGAVSSGLDHIHKVAATGKGCEVRVVHTTNTRPAPTNGDMLASFHTSTAGDTPSS